MFLCHLITWRQDTNERRVASSVQKINVGAGTLQLRESSLSGPTQSFENWVGKYFAPRHNLCRSSKYEITRRQKPVAVVVPIEYATQQCVLVWLPTERKFFRAKRM
jgi:hypothetical protein